MADNYLEKQMEQYQARKQAWEREKKFGKKKKPLSRSAASVSTSTPSGMPEQEDASRQ